MYHCAESAIFNVLNFELRYSFTSLTNHDEWLSNWSNNSMCIQISNDNVKVILRIGESSNETDNWLLQRRHLQRVHVRCISYLRFWSISTSPRTSFACTEHRLIWFSFIFFSMAAYPCSLRITSSSGLVSQTEGSSYLRNIAALLASLLRGGRDSWNKWLSEKWSSW